MVLKKRILSPPFSPNYRSYKPYLRLEFDHRCVYCGIHEAEDGGSGKFHIDHYQPQKRFPQRCNDYLNLFYSCSDCNKFKSDFWPNILQLFMNEFILNPCDHDFDEHYERTNPEWLAKTGTAAWNINRLRLNSPIRQQIRVDRAYLIKLIATLEQQKLSLIDNFKRFDSANVDKKNKIQYDIENTQKQIDAINRKINTPRD